MRGNPISEAGPCSRTCCCPPVLGWLDDAVNHCTRSAIGPGSPAAAVMPKLQLGCLAAAPAALPGLACARWLVHTRGQRPGAMGLPRRRSLATSHPGRLSQPAPAPQPTHNRRAAPIRALPGVQAQG